MLLLALLPLLALPGALAGPLQRQSPLKRDDYTPTDGSLPLRFIDTGGNNGINRYEARFSLNYQSKYF
jgi:hypothetical protein